jgi:hypothetical protein
LLRDDGRLQARNMLTFERFDGALPDVLTGNAELMNCIAENLDLDGWV